MIAKKSSSANLEKKRTILFGFGLLVAGSFTLAAFTYSVPTMTKKEKERVASTSVDYVLEMKEQPKDEPVVHQRQQEDRSDDRSNPNLGDPSTPTQDSRAVNNGSTTPDPGIGLGLPGVGLPNTGIRTVDLKGEPEEWPKVPASYIGGAGEMQLFINNETEYPEDARELGEQGIVYVSFIVEKDGSVSNIGIERGAFKSLDREAKRVVRSFPKWKPGENEYGPVRTIVRLPIKFILSN